MILIFLIALMKDFYLSHIRFCSPVENIPGIYHYVPTLPKSKQLFEGKYEAEVFQLFLALLENDDE